MGPGDETADDISAHRSVVGCFTTIRLSSLISPLKNSLSSFAANAVSQVAGVFGPASMTWRMNREAILFLAAGRALLLQLAHPWIAAAIAEHSSALTNPFVRFHRTFRVVFTMIFRHSIRR